VVRCPSRLVVSLSAVLAVAVVAAGEGPSSGLLGVSRFDAASHIPGRSAGCGKDSPYRPGKTSVVHGHYAGKRWLFRVYVPYAYHKHRPMPLLLQFPGWGMSAKNEEAGCGITARADSLGFISVTPQGQQDNDNFGGPWFSWNAVGSTQSPGPAGPTCTEAANIAEYCYTSCEACKDLPQCDWTTCDDGVTPTGTGTRDVGGFIPGLCIDTTREFAAGESNGGMMAYQVGVDMAKRLAAIFPQFGSFHRGFNLAPSVGLPVMDLHGTQDVTVPANVSLSSGGYYYTVTDEIFGGNDFSPGWMKSNDCYGPESHYPTEWDGQDELYCVSVGNCPGGDVVKCSWNGGHNWYGHSARMNGGLVTEFLLKWTRPSHVGRGYSRGEQVSAPTLLQDLEIVSVEDPPTLEEALRGAKSVASGSEELTSPPGLPLHYGDPDIGCLGDEEIIFVGTGRACAPKISVKMDSTTGKPEPLCKIGGTAPRANGCPGDFPRGAGTWPVCLGKGNRTDGYGRGDFHCFIVCPCPVVDPEAGKHCGAEADKACPGESQCERGELMNRAHGLCSYHGTPTAEIAVASIVV